MNHRDKLRFLTALIIISAVQFFAWPSFADSKSFIHIVLQASGTDKTPVNYAGLDRLAAVISNRIIDQYHLTGHVQTDNKDKVIIDLPADYFDTGRVKIQNVYDLISRTGRLDFREVLDETPSVHPEPQRKNYDNDEQFLKAQKRWKKAVDENNGAKAAFEERAKGIQGAIVATANDAGSYYLLGPVLLSNFNLNSNNNIYDYIQTASLCNDSLGRVSLALFFTAEGALRFEDITGRLVGRQIAILLDNVVLSDPMVHDRMSGGRAQITGKFQLEEAMNIAIMLCSGVLPLPVEIIENKNIRGN